MPSSHLNHQVHKWCGVQNGQNLIWLYKENNFHEQWPMTYNSLTQNEEHDIPSQILKTIFGLHASAIFQTTVCVVSRSIVGSYDPKL